MMMQATARLYGLEEEVETFTAEDKLRFEAKVVALVASSESALGVLRANLMPEWSRFVCIDPAPPITIARLREIVTMAEEAGYALVEPERGMRGGAAIERAIHAFLTDGSLAKAFMFVPRSEARSNGVVKLREQRALDGGIESKLELSTNDVAETAFAILRERGAMRGAELLREARARYGKTSTQDAMVIGKAIVEAWHSSQAKIDFRE
jgi:hypothetical protein